MLYGDDDDDDEGDDDDNYDLFIAGLRPATLLK